MNLDDVSVFLQIVASGSLTRAARVMRKPKTSLSHQLKRLEGVVGAPLFQRQSNKLELSDAGYEFLHHAREIKRVSETGINAIRDQRTETTGGIKIALTSELTSTLLPPILVHFMHQFPDVGVHLMVFPKDNLPEVREHYDCIIYLGDPPLPQFSDMTSRLLGNFSFAAYSSTEYLERGGTPVTPNDLRSHSLIGFHNGEFVEPWQLTNGTDTSSIQPGTKLLSNEYWTVKHMCIRGHGICFVPTFFTALEESEGLMTRILPDWLSRETPIFLLFKKHRFTNPNLRALINSITEHFDDVYSLLYTIQKPTASQRH